MSVIIGAINRDSVRGTWVGSHYAWLLRTFCWGILWVVLATVVGAYQPRPGVDFFPLTVNYQEKFFAAGKIPGGYFKREGRPTERETLISRLIDRPIRPLFADGYKNVIYLGERDCSLQRKHQKIMEEAPAPDITRKLRARIGELLSLFLADEVLVREVDEELDAGLAALAHHLHALVPLGGHRLFAQHVAAGARRCDRLPRMQPAGRGQHRDVELGARQQRVEAVERCHAVAADARHGVHRTHAMHQRVGDGLEHQVAGAMAMPALGETYWAARGGGAWMSRGGGEHTYFAPLMSISGPVQPSIWLRMSPRSKWMSARRLEALKVMSFDGTEAFKDRSFARASL